MKRWFLLAAVLGLFAIVGCQPQPNISVNNPPPQSQNIIVAPPQRPGVIVQPVPVYPRPGLSINVGPRWCPPPYYPPYYPGGININVGPHGSPHHHHH